MITLVYKTALNLSRGNSNLKMKCSVVLPWSYALAWFLTWGINCTRFCQEHSSSDRLYEMNLSFQASSLCNLREMGNGARQAGSCILGLPGYHWLRNPFLPLPSPHSLRYFFASNLSYSFFLPATPSFLPQMLIDCFVTSPYMDMAVLCADTADKGSTEPLVSSQHSVTATCFEWLNSLLPSDPNSVVSPRETLLDAWACEWRWTIVLSQHCGRVCDVAVESWNVCS